MDYLALVTRSWEESGLSNNPPTSVVDQTGMAKKFVNWVADAYAWVQGERENWNVDWAETSHAFTANEDTYDPSAAPWSITVGAWNEAEQTSYVYRTAGGLATRTWLHYIQWEQFVGLNVPEIENNIPIYWTVKPDGNVVYFPTPSLATYTAVHQYWRGEEVLTVANTSTPARLPTRFHMAIVWRAVMFYCGHNKDSALYQHASLELSRIMARLRRDKLPDWRTPGALA